MKLLLRQQLQFAPSLLYPVLGHGLASAQNQDNIILLAVQIVVLAQVRVKLALDLLQLIAHLASQAILIMGKTASNALAVHAASVIQQIHRSVSNAHLGTIFIGTGHARVAAQALIQQ